MLAVVDDGRRVTTEGVFIGTNSGPLTTPQGELPPSGRPLRLPYLDVWESEAGRITSHRVYYDQMGMAAQLGLLAEAATAIGEQDEAVRCADFLRDSSPEGHAALLG